MTKKEIKEYAENMIQCDKLHEFDKFIMSGTRMLCDAFGRGDIRMSDCLRILQEYDTLKYKGSQAEKDFLKWERELLWGSKDDYLTSLGKLDFKGTPMWKRRMDDLFRDLFTFGEAFDGPFKEKYQSKTKPMKDETPNYAVNIQEDGATIHLSPGYMLDMDETKIVVKEIERPKERLKESLSCDGDDINIELSIPFIEEFPEYVAPQIIQAIRKIKPDFQYRVDAQTNYQVTFWFDGKTKHTGWVRCWCTGDGLTNEFIAVCWLEILAFIVLK